MKGPIKPNEKVSIDGAASESLSKALIKNADNIEGELVFIWYRRGSYISVIDDWIEIRLHKPRLLAKSKKLIKGTTKFLF